MDKNRSGSSDVAFTATVKAIQARKGSRRGYAQMEEKGGWTTVITPELANFIAAQTSVFLATANSEGQPYIQHRGGPPGFLRVLDDRTIGFVDFAGNRQYITQGNLADNPKAYLFLIDYAHRRRIKIWGTARVVEGDVELVKKLLPEGYRAQPEQVILFTVSAWSANCPQHIRSASTLPMWRRLSPTVTSASQRSKPRSGACAKTRDPLSGKCRFRCGRKSQKFKAEAAAGPLSALSVLAVPTS